MPLYTKKKPGLYTTGGDWSDPSIWTDETGAAANRVPTSSDDVYIMGSVTGSGEAANIIVSENPPGILIRARPSGFYISGGDWSDPANWTDEKGNPLNAVPTASDNVFVTGNVTGSGEAANITVGTIEEIGWALAVAQTCCCTKCEKCCWKVVNRSESSTCPGPKATVIHGAPPGLRLDFSDSGNCGGPCGNDDTQSIYLETIYETTQPVTLTVNATGLVERQNNLFDTLSVIVNGQQILYLEAFNEGKGCAMRQQSGSGSIELAPGCHTISVEAGTNDEFYHVGFYYEVTFSVSGGSNTDTCDTEICGTYDCDPAYGCQPNTTGTGTYPNLAACEAECATPTGYYCNEYQGCREAFGSNVVYTTLEECENSGACDSGFTCDAGIGCINKYGAAAGPYADAAACEAACFEVYACNTASGCIPNSGFEGGSGQFSDNPADQSQSECEAACIQRFTCDAINGCTNTGFATTGDTQTECETTCVVQSYLCSYDTNCAPRYDTSGNFTDATTCAESCLERAFCDIDSGCQYLGFGTDGALYADCATECVIQSYTCDTNYACRGLYQDTSGQFATLAECDAACLLRYECQTSYDYWSGAPTLMCVYLGYATTGQTQAECDTSCVAQSYSCDASAGCTPLQDTSGAYATQAECSASCVEHYECVNPFGYFYCSFVDYRAGGVDYNTCQQTCVQAMQMPPSNEQENYSELFTEAKNLQAAPNNTAEFQRYFVSSRPVFPPKPLQEEDPTGPGTMLSGMLEKIGIKSSPTCSCKARARIMNAHGNDWCAENLDLITGWLREEAQKRKLPFVDFAGRLLIKRAISLSRAAKRKDEAK